jgi:superfamily II DNA/RNA helicase
VMTTYRKLAASSLAAISTALEKRKRTLINGEVEKRSLSAHEDYRYVEAEEDITSSTSEFFHGELQLLDELVDRANTLIASDSKVRYFLEEAVPAVLAKNQREKLLIFTEYRSTQDHLVASLRSRYGEESISMIRGGQTFEERRAAMEHFEGEGQFLVSTEAGSEGLNLHRNCNIMVNFDLPWNPMRLVQRVGRLYRYGQDKRVVVFNMHVPDTLDNEVLKKMYDRLETVAAEMAGVSDEYREGLREDILGELVGNLDMAAIEEMLEAAGQGDVERTEERLEFALRRAQEAAETQEEILSYASGYDPSELRNELKLDDRHLMSFAAGWCEQLGIEITNRLYDDKVWDVRLPAQLQEKLGGRQKLRLAFEKSAARKAASASLFAPEQPLYELFVRLAKDPRSGGQVAATSSLDGTAGLGAMLRWIDLRGRPVYREYVGIRLLTDGTLSVNDECWAEMLLWPMTGEAVNPPPSREMLARLRSQLDAELSRRSSEDVHPDRPYPIGALWGSLASSGDFAPQKV